jgi:DNA topoisomerase-3
VPTRAYKLDYYDECSRSSQNQNAGKELEDAEARKLWQSAVSALPPFSPNIIETLILRDYIRRDRKSIIPKRKAWQF